MVPMFRLFLSIGLVVGLASCVATGKTRWEKAGASADQWALDRADCRRRAARKVERDYTSSTRVHAAGGINTGSAYDAQMQRHGARRSTLSLTEDCLRRLGYAKVKVAADTKE